MKRMTSSLNMKTLTAIIALTLCGCMSPAKLLTGPCDGSDPYELGRQHGTQGLAFPSADTVSSPIYQCVPLESGEARKKYDIGYNSGLADYCTKENGFTIGRSNLTYSNVCPTLSERNFLSGYEIGKEVRKTLLENQKLESKISLLQRDLQTLSPQSEQSEIVSQQIARLKDQLSKNQQKIKTESL